MSITTTFNIPHALLRQGYTFVKHTDIYMHDNLHKAARDLLRSWEELETDGFLPGKWAFRLRRFSRFRFHPDQASLHLLPASPYYQHIDHNSYVGGIARSYADLTASICTNPYLHALIKFDFEQFPVPDQLKSEAWIAGVHQFRVLAEKARPGEPTPEGIHQDGHTYFAVHLIRRRNIEGGKSCIFDLNRQEIEQYCMEKQMDSLFVIDKRVMHSVSPICVKPPAIQGERDVLIIEFDRLSDLIQRNALPPDILDKFLL